MFEIKATESPINPQVARQYSRERSHGSNHGSNWQNETVSHIRDHCTRCPIQEIKWGAPIPDAFNCVPRVQFLKLVSKWYWQCCQETWHGISHSWRWRRCHARVRSANRHQIHWLELLSCLWVGLPIWRRCWQVDRPAILEEAAIQSSRGATSTSPRSVKQATCV